MTMTENQLKDGRVVGIAGPVIDVEFPRDSIPMVYEALKLVDDGLTLEVDALDGQPDADPEHSGAEEESQKRKSSFHGAMAWFTRAASSCRPGTGNSQRSLRCRIPSLAP